MILAFDVPKGAKRDEVAAAIADLVAGLEVFHPGQVRLVIEAGESPRAPAQAAPPPRRRAPAAPKVREGTQLAGELVELAGSQVAAAELVGVSSNMLGRWSLGKAQPKGESLDRLRVAVASARRAAAE